MHSKDSRESKTLPRKIELGPASSSVDDWVFHEGERKQDFSKIK
jgi:hypothetical protein